MRLVHKQQEEIQELRELTEKLENSPAFKAMEAEAAAKLVKKRHLLVKKLETLNQDALALVSSHNVDELILKLDAVEIERKSLVGQLSEARGQLRQEKAGIKAQIEVKTEFLIRTCDPALDMAIDYFREKLDFLRQDGRISTQRFSFPERKLFSGKIKNTIQSNFESVSLAMKYCQKAIETLELWKLDAELDLARLEKLKAEIPSVDTFLETDCERPIPGIREAVG
jgi:hypothetical protein